MKPIINPLWFYLIDIGQNVSVFLFVSAFFLGGALLAIGLFDFIDDSWDEWKKTLKTLTIMCITCSVLCAFVPSEDTCYKMMAATMVTPDNITAVGNTATDVIDYIVDSIDQLLEDNEKEEQ